MEIAYAATKLLKTDWTTSYTEPCGNKVRGVSPCNILTSATDCCHGIRGQWSVITFKSVLTASRSFLIGQWNRRRTDDLVDIIMQSMSKISVNCTSVKMTDFHTLLLTLPVKYIKIFISYVTFWRSTNSAVLPQWIIYLWTASWSISTVWCQKTSSGYGLLLTADVPVCSAQQWHQMIDRPCI